MQLRDYQKDIIEKIRQVWDSGVQNILIQLPTGAGKTVVFSHVISQHPGASIAIAHRVELVSQMSIALARNDIRHNIIASKATIREIISIHMSHFNKSFYNIQAQCTVASVDTLLKHKDTTFFEKITLLIIDEAHHVLKENKWGKAVSLFKNAHGLYPTATPSRTDGKGLGRRADGVIDTLIEGPPMRTLIQARHLTDYRIFAPPNNLDLTQVGVSAAGDYSPDQLRKAVHKSQVLGDVVTHYLKIADKQQGITFAVDVEAAIEIAQNFRKSGVSAEVISSKTSALLRNNIMRQFRNKEIKQLVNVDILGEGVDVPAVTVISMARPTQSFALFMQQFGRALRPSSDKKYAIIIDHVGNTLRHGLPDTQREWSLNRRQKKSCGTVKIHITTCLECFGVYSRKLRVCPFCDHQSPKTLRAAIEYVDGDLLEIDLSALRLLQDNIKEFDNINTKHDKKEQQALRYRISLYAGFLKSRGYTDSQIYKEFYSKFGIDILSAQLLNANESFELYLKIRKCSREIK